MKQYTEQLPTVVTPSFIGDYLTITHHLCASMSCLCPIFTVLVPAHFALLANKRGEHKSCLWKYQPGQCPGSDLLYCTPLEV